MAVDSGSNKISNQPEITKASIFAMAFVRAGAQEQGAVK
jgi:hypothetical protein